MYDVVVIGGGPAGMIAAGRAGERGRSVLLLEKNAGLGKKLLITGGGRCNVTNNKKEVRKMLSQYKSNDKFLFSAFAQFAVKDALDFFNSRGMATKEENENRMFPVSNSAKSVWEVLVKYMKKSAVKVETGMEVTGISVAPKTKHIIVKLKNKKEIVAKVCILATGGTSLPETGSTGEGFGFLKKLGHTIIENDFALVPVRLSDPWVKKLGGVSLGDIKLTVLQDKERRASAKGKILFTHFGISGPTVLNMSKEVGELLKYGEVTIELDLFPKKDFDVLRRELQELLIGESNKKLKNTLRKFIPASLALALLEISNIDGDTANNSVSTESRKKLVALMKAVPLHVFGLLGADKAIVSSGGVALKQVNFKTMESRLVSGLYLVGDVLNIDRPSGGYSLQLCWTTGFVAGNNV
ncbi:MAG TPA: aminoacetone oxidase family FAD-binding enzyme [Candidatus Paceibacterota bacterium]|jgi:predicted Rossmann fold flavoprotein|nr:aminoacetone oxidase family FAD-binding enzyme [Candidatus Paceibacterota bacterium]